MKHKHIPFGNGHITWTGEADPTTEQLEAFEKMRELALNMHVVSGRLPIGSKVTIKNIKDQYKEDAGKEKTITGYKGNIYYRLDNELNKLFLIQDFKR